MQTKGQDLLDLSLYLSSVNYAAVTRKQFSTFLAFPLSWILPHSLRAGAKARVAHLGLSSLDIDSDEQPEEDKNPVPESLRKKDGPSSILGNPESAAQIRLHGLAKGFLQPLQDLRGQGRFFVGDKPTTLDCLAMGYLGLALFPDLPSPWLANTVRNEFPQLAAFVHDMQKMFFGGATSLADAGVSLSEDEEKKEREKRTIGKSGLPWSYPPSGGLLDIAKAVGGHMASNIPIISDVLKARRIQLDLEAAAEADPDRVEELALEHHKASVFKKELLMSVGSVALGVGLFVTFLVKQGVLAAIVGNMESKVNAREQGEKSTWETEEREEVPNVMDFLGGGMQFGDLQEHNHTVAEVGVEGGVVPDRTL